MGKEGEMKKRREDVGAKESSDCVLPSGFGLDKGSLKSCWAYLAQFVFTAYQFIIAWLFYGERVARFWGKGVCARSLVGRPTSHRAWFTKPWLIYLQYKLWAARFCL